VSFHGYLPGTPDYVAEQLLLEHLSPCQTKTYGRCGWFYVEGQRRRRCVRRFYALYDGMWVVRVRPDDGGSWRSHGFYVLSGRAWGGGDLPLADRVLAQMLVLETNLEFFFECCCNAHAPWMALTYDDFAEFRLERNAPPSQLRLAV
jgi:hypothetical protein